MAWGRFTFLGRVRSWDGLLALVRVSVSVPVSSVVDPPNLTFRRTNQPHGDDRNGSSEATSTMERFSLVAGAV